MSVDQARAALLTTTPLNKARKIALEKKLTSENKLNGVDMTKLATEENKKTYLSFGEGRAFGDLEKGGLMTVEMNKAREAGDGDLLQQETNKLIKKLTKKDINSMPFKELFSGKSGFGLSEGALSKIAGHIASALATENHSLVANILPGLDSTSRNKFITTYKNEIKNEYESILTLPPGDEQRKRAERLEGAQEAFDKTLANYAIGFSPETPSGGGTPPPTPTP